LIALQYWIEHSLKSATSGRAAARSSPAEIRFAAPEFAVTTA
jgi:hypothetical protein